MSPVGNHIVSYFDCRRRYGGRRRWMGSSPAAGATAMDAAMPLSPPTDDRSLSPLLLSLGTPTFKSTKLDRKSL